MTAATQPEPRPFDIAAAIAFVASTAGASGLEVAPDKLMTAAAQLVASVERAPDGTLSYTPDGFATAYRMEKGEVVNIPLGEHMAGIIRRNATPIPVKVSPPVEQSVATSSAPEWAKRGTGAISGFARALAEKEDAAIVREAEGWPNPWMPAQLNRTRQQILINKDPARAARLQKEAAK